MAKIELHAIQSFGPSCLNRDDTNSPKECQFGGVTRARISSQSLKHAQRMYIKNNELLDPSQLGIRTKMIVTECANLLVADGKGEDEATLVASNAVRGVMKKAGAVKKDGLTEYLLFVGNEKVADLAELCKKNWKALSAKDFTPKKEGDLAKELAAVMTNDKAVDLAMFGRMLADLPEYNIDGACQEAHAISTHKIDAEIDFFTAVDEKKPEESKGAGMMGTVEFDAPCYYRYASVDMIQMVNNLNGDVALARDGVKAFLEAFALAIPGGKQNTFAAHNPPSMLLAVVREHGNSWNLLNAFERPIRPERDGGLIASSIKALCGYWDALVSFYGDAGITSSVAAVLKSEGLPEDLDLLKNGVSNLPDLIAGIMTGYAKAEEGA